MVAGEGFEGFRARAREEEEEEAGDDDAASEDSESSAARRWRATRRRAERPRSPPARASALLPSDPDARGEARGGRSSAIAAAASFPGGRRRARAPADATRAANARDATTARSASVHGRACRDLNAAALRADPARSGSDASEEDIGAEARGGARASDASGEEKRGEATRLKGKKGEVTFDEHFIQTDRCALDSAARGVFFLKTGGCTKSPAQGTLFCNVHVSRSRPPLTSSPSRARARARARVPSPAVSPRRRARAPRPRRPPRPFGR